MSKLLDFIVATNGNDYPQEVDSIREDLRNLADPNYERNCSPADAGEFLDEMLGWNPIRHFDENYIGSKYEEILSSAPLETREDILDKLPKDTFVNLVISFAGEVHEEALDNIMRSLLQETIGWEPEFDVLGSDESVAERVIKMSQSWASDDPEEDEDADEDDDENFAEDEDDDDYVDSEPDSWDP